MPRSQRVPRNASAGSSSSTSVSSTSEDALCGSPRMVDCFRAFHPLVHGAYTCWCQTTGARETNSGTRIDYLLASPGLAESLQGAGQWPGIQGSDHCPVWATFAVPLQRDRSGARAGAPAYGRTSSSSSSSSSSAPRQMDPYDPKQDPLCTASWASLRARQQTISSFFSSGPLPQGGSSASETAVSKATHGDIHGREGMGDVAAGADVAEGAVVGGASSHAPALPSIPSNAAAEAHKTSDGVVDLLSDSDSDGGTKADKPRKRPRVESETATRQG